MKNLFSETSTLIKHSPYIVPVFFCFLGIFVVACGLAWESYDTTRGGYAMLPTAKVHDWIIPLAAFLPQLATVAFFYIWMQNTDRRWALTVAVLFASVDLATDVAFKAHGQGAGVYLLAAVESFILFTIGAHALLTISFGTIMELLPDFIAQIHVLFERIAGSLVSSATTDKRDESRRGLS